MYKKHIFLRVFSKIAIFACVFCAFFVSPVFAKLPAGYTELEYIESTGTQYIDTGIIPNSTSEFEIECTQTVLSGVDYQSMWGAVRTDSGYNDYQQFYYSRDGSVYVRLGKSVSTGTNSASPNLRNVWNMDGTKNIVSFHNNTGVLKVNNQEYSGKSCNGTSIGNLTIFGGHIKTSGSYMYQMGAGKIYVFKWWLNSELVLDLIPAKRNSDNVIGMYDTVSNTFFTNSGTGEFVAGPDVNCKTVGTDGVTCTECESGYKLDSNGGCVGVIEIATTKMVDEEFAAAEANLAATVQTIESVVSRTIAQTGQIQILQDTKQTRPDETCPANMKCLLVQDEDGTPHWYEIIEPVPAFNAVEFLNRVINTSGNTSYYAGNTTTYNELGNSGSADTNQPPASSGLRQLNETEWVVQWNDKVAVYGTSVCNNNSGTWGVASSTEQTETKGLNCWCKMTSVVDPDGVEHNVSSAWVFNGPDSSAASCANSCARDCAYYVRGYAGFRAAVFGSVNW